MPGFRTLLLLPIGIAFLFAAIHLLLTDGDMSRVRSVFGTGFLLGLIVVPEVDKRFKRPRLVQMSAGCLAGTLLAAYFSSSLIIWLIGSLTGTLLGATARYWMAFPFNQDSQHQ